MFKELTPILSKRSLVLTLTALSDSELIRVTVTPRSLGSDDPKALSTPLSVEGTAEELDNGLSSALVSYVAEHLTIDRALANVKAAMDAELKAAKDEAAKKVTEAKKVGTVKTAAKPAVDPKKEEPRKPEPMPSLFGEPEPEPAAPPVNTAVVPPASTVEAGDDDEEAFLLGESNDGTEDDAAAA